MSEPVQYKVESTDGYRFQVYKRTRGFLGFMHWKYLGYELSLPEAEGLISRQVGYDRATTRFPKFYSSAEF